jgi:hypothetical protein
MPKMNFDVGNACCTDLPTQTSYHKLSGCFQFSQETSCCTASIHEQSISPHIFQNNNNMPQHINTNNNTVQHKLIRPTVTLLLILLILYALLCFVVLSCVGCLLRCCFCWWMGVVCGVPVP